MYITYSTSVLSYIMQDFRTESPMQSLAVVSAAKFLPIRSWSGERIVSVVFDYSYF